MLFKLLGFILTIIVFIGLKIWELLKFTWKITKYWKMGLYIIGLLIVVSVWAYLVELQVEYFNVHGGIVLLANFIILIILIMVGMSIYNNRLFVSMFCAENWVKAKEIVNERILKGEQNG
jgi:hypothetical protein